MRTITEPEHTSTNYSEQCENNSVSHDFAGAQETGLTQSSSSACTLRKAEDDQSDTSISEPQTDIEVVDAKDNCSTGRGSSIVGESDTGPKETTEETIKL